MTRSDAKKACDLRYRERHRDTVRAQGRRHYAAHRDAMSAKGKVFHRRTRQVVLDHYGGKCACCGEARFEFLAIDHINGGGGQHRRSLGYNANNTYWLIRNDFPPGFRVLCHNCNMSLGIYGYCPHQPKEA